MKHNLPRVGFAPLTSDNNKYIGITVDCLKAAGAEVYEFYTIFSSLRRFFATNIVMLNWFERLGSAPARRLAKLIAKKLIVTALRLTGKKIVYVFHNRVNHEERGNRQSLRFMRYILKNADRIVILCSESVRYLEEYLPPEEARRKAFLIPHPDYIGAYEPNVPKLRALVPPLDDTRITFLFTGAVRPYKNIELILEAARNARDLPFRFIVAGRPRTDAYRAGLEKLAEGLDNVTLIMSFLDDDVITALIAESDALILPYDRASSLNSGTVILGFSTSRTVVCPRIGTLSDFSSEVAFAYEYDSAESHLAALTDTLKSIASLGSDAASIRMALRSKGEAARAELLEKNSKELVTARYSELLAELVR
jgi:glycosyltransferase involved in cell wall biosynthesis